MNQKSCASSLPCTLKVFSRHVSRSIVREMSLTATTNARSAGLNVLKLCLGGSKRRRLSTHVKPNVEESDIVIVGGGPAGLALASALGSYSLPRLQSMILRRDRISSVSEKKHEDYSDRGWRFGYNQSLESGAGFFLKSRQFAHKCLANISTRYV
jgi:hypothetical protein